MGSVRLKENYGENRSEKPLDVPRGIDLIDVPQTEFIQKFFCRPPAPAFAHFVALPDRSDAPWYESSDRIGMMHTNTARIIFEFRRAQVAVNDSNSLDF